MTHNTNRTLPSISASNDGSQIAVVWANQSSNIYIADIARAGPGEQWRNVRRLTFAEADEYPHAWTADSQAVIFESNRNGHYQIYRQGIGQREAEQLVMAEGSDMLPQVSQDGKWVLYREDLAGRRRLTRAPVAGGAPEAVPIGGKLDEFRCALHSGCVLRSTESDQFVFYELDPVRGQGRELARTSWSPTVTADWDLSPDGAEVAIPDHDPRDAKIRLVPLRDVAPGARERIVTITGLNFLSGVVWAADGRGWYVSSRTTAGLWYVNLQGEMFNLVESITPRYAVPSRDGSHVAFPGQISSSNVWAARR